VRLDPSLLVPPLVGLFGILVLVLPIVRLWLQTGTLAFVGFRSSDWRHQAAGAAFFVLVAFAGVYGGLVGALPAARLGIVPRPEWVGVAGVALMAAATGYIMVAQAQMGASWRIGIDDRPTALVATGLFRFSRHPIYTGVLGWMAGLVGVAPSPWSAVAAVGVTVALMVQARLEEEHLIALHGDAYRAYARRVGRFVPGSGRLG
jgi:protein-S-isoprenylcysteine O-methyltransferase Ste14